MVLEEVQSELILVVDDPDEEEAITLDVVQGQFHDLLVCQR